MAMLVRTLLISAYSAIVVQFIIILLTDRIEELIELRYVVRTPGLLKKLNREIRKHGRNYTQMTHNFKKPIRLPTDLKFILIYTQAFSHYGPAEKGQSPFIDNGCNHTNCFVTNDKTLLIDIRNFDAILYDVENNWDEYPVFRSPHQKYVFTALESADNYPVCQPFFEDFYNWTWTYRLDSDIPRPYVKIYDKNGTLVGPRVNPRWIESDKPITRDLKQKLSTKSKIAAWFVSNCLAKSRRDLVTKKIQKALKKNGFKIDIYGWCGNLKCPRDQIDECLEMLGKDYLFYLAFENSKSVDYVTEKILYPLKHNTVPIVFGGANYSRFLPPGSYIDANVLTPEAVASLMVESFFDRKLYYRFFRWHHDYTFTGSRTTASDWCSLCEILNTSPGESVAKNFRTWWNPEYEQLCNTSFTKVPTEEENKNNDDNINNNEIMTHIMMIY